MTTNDMIEDLMKTVSNLQRDVQLLKEDKDYLYNKLEKAYGDRIELRAENEKLKQAQVSVNTTEEEECLACSA
jgi:FtsZ-binding cell division protein ZapB